MNDYEVLGISPNADPKEIKRAYFRLVRQYSPETHPERFQEIREAYEHLTSEANSRENPDAVSMEFPDLPYMDELRQRINSKLQTGDYQEAVILAERAVSVFGESEGFLFLQGKAQKAAGNTGKAVKSFERLVELFPQKALYRQELAIALLSRGFGKKAYQAFEEAYAMGCSSIDFLNLFAICCNDRKNYKQAVKLLDELIAKGEKKPKDYINELLNAFVGIFSIKFYVLRQNISQDLEHFYQFLGKVVPYLAEDMYELFSLLKLLSGTIPKNPENLPLLNQIIELSEKSLRVHYPKKNDAVWREWEDLMIDNEHVRIHNDGRLSEVLKTGFEAFLMLQDDAEINRFAQRDMELCILEEWPSIRSQIELIQNEYPIYWHAIEEFIEKLEKEQNLDHLRNRLIKDYDRWEKYFNGGLYYENYPHRRPWAGVTRWNSDDDGTYTRTTPKIGRNSPCPCGSGKKYKNCCGKNG